MAASPSVEDRLNHMSAQVDELVAEARRNGAALALAEKGKAVVPLLKRLLHDEHHGLRAGALATLRHIYASDSKEFRTDVSPEQAESSIDVH